MNPQPITSGTSVVGYACGVCGSVQTAHRTDPSERDLLLPRTDATDCCVCATCGAIDASIGASQRCAACHQRESAVLRARRDAAGATAVSNYEVAALHHEAAWAIVLDDGRTGKVYLCEEGHGFFDVYGRLDPTEYDTAPEVASETLRRNAGSAVADVMGALADRVDAMVQRMEKVQ